MGKDRTFRTRSVRAASVRETNPRSAARVLDYGTKPMPKAKRRRILRNELADRRERAAERTLGGAGTITLGELDAARLSRRSPELWRTIRPLCRCLGFGGSRDCGRSAELQPGVRHADGSNSAGGRSPRHLSSKARAQCLSKIRARASPSESQFRRLHELLLYVGHYPRTQSLQLAN